MDNGNGISPNAKRILWAGFMAILAEGVGFSVRAGILGDWGKQFGFTQTELGEITGGGHERKKTHQTNEEGGARPDIYYDEK